MSICFRICCPERTDVMAVGYQLFFSTEESKRRKIDIYIYDYIYITRKYTRATCGSGAALILLYRASPGNSPPSWHARPYCCTRLIRLVDHQTSGSSDEQIMRPRPSDQRILGQGSANHSIRQPVESPFTAGPRVGLNRAWKCLETLCFCPHVFSILKFCSDVPQGLSCGCCKWTLEQL